MNLLDLFSGIGAFSLGLERSGAFRTVAFCEVDPFCRRVLAKHWPEVPCYDDVRSLTAERLRTDGISVDAICGGFPCQDISVAGRGVGISGERSGLWSEFARLIGELRPHFVLVENVAALLGRGLGTVLGDLAALGFDAEWHCIPASAVGAPHRRDRIWIVAYPGEQSCGWQRRVAGDATDEGWRTSEPIRASLRSSDGEACTARPGASGADVAYTAGKRFQRPEFLRSGHDIRPQPSNKGGALADAIRLRQLQQDRSVAYERGWLGNGGWWSTEPDMGRVAHGVPARVDRLRSLGNSLVPQIPELIGRAIAAQHRETTP